MINTRLVLKSIVQLYYTVLHGVTVQGSEKLPVCGPYIIASNHITNHDPILLSAFLNDTIHFMAKEELFRIPILRWIVERLQAFPVKRSGIGIGGIRRAVRILNVGDVVGIFPEGTRNRHGRKLQCKPGVGFIAIKANFTPIVPVAIYVEKGRLFKQFQIIVGDVIVPLNTDYRLLAENIMQNVYYLRSSVQVEPPSCVTV